MSHMLEESDWTLLVTRIRDGECTPFLGAGMCYGTLPLGADIARNWARQYQYPLTDVENLMQVSQYLAIKLDSDFPKKEIAKQIRETSPPDFSKADEPHGLLAELPFPIYITTNYDDFLSQALRRQNKNPTPVICRWHEDIPGNAFNLPEAAPTSEKPIVFHLHGHHQLPGSMVLTQDDYLDFIQNISRDVDLIPNRIEEVLASTSLLFLGYRLADWNFLVILRSIVQYMKRSRIRAHISVQLAPVGEDVSEEQVERVQDYLTKYFDDMKIRVYWGTVRQFAAELRSRLEAPG